MSNPKFIVVHRVDENNVGDMASNPLQYFLKPNEYKVIDVVKLHSTTYSNNIPLILGGGGLLGNEFLSNDLRNLLLSADYSRLKSLWNQRWDLCDKNNQSLHENFLLEYQALIKKYIDSLATTQSPRFVWGAGHNGDFDRKFRGRLNYPDWISDFNLVGIRDVDQNLPWAPCASCMHPALAKSYEIKNDVIWFEHKKQLIKDFGNDSIPRFVNSGNNIDQTIELLGSANIILTNSYHGAYWGTLMGKKVIVVDAWSSKFQAMKHAPYLLSDAREWKKIVDEVPVYPDALNECRDTTQNFWNKIQEQL